MKKIKNRSAVSLGKKRAKKAHEGKTPEEISQIYRELRAKRPKKLPTGPDTSL